MTPTYRFWVELNGERLVWRGLTQAQAEQMYKRTLSNLDTLDHATVRFGVEVTK